MASVDEYGYITLDENTDTSTSANTNSGNNSSSSNNRERWLHRACSGF